MLIWSVGVGAQSKFWSQRHFDASFAKERTGCALGEILTIITTRGVEKGASISTVVGFNSIVIHRQIGTALAADSADLANAV